MTSKQMASQQRVSLVVGDPVYLKLLTNLLEKASGSRVRSFLSASDFLKNPYPHPNLVVFDLSLLDMDGETFVQQVKMISDEIKTVVISGKKEVDAAVGLLKLGVFTNLEKDKHLKETLTHAVSMVKKVVPQQEYAYI